MKRVLTFLMTFLLVVGSLAVGVFTADLPFWQRAFELPLAPDGAYLPSATIGRDVPVALAAVPPAESAFDATAVETVATRVRNAGSRALLVMRHGRLEIERYFAADDERTLLPAGFIARPVAAMAVGRAIAAGHIPSLDTPIGEILAEWTDSPRGRITVRQLLEETSGLETGGDFAGLAQRSPWSDLHRLPAFATSKGVRMMLGNDFPSTALGFSLRHEPGGFYNRSPANTQLAAVLVERASGEPYEKYVDALWQGAGAGHAELQLDRRAGMPAAHCCFRAAARDVLRIANLLVQENPAVLPAGWAAQMSRRSRVNADTGLELSREVHDGLDVLSSSDDTGSSFWVVPQLGLTIVNVAGPGGGVMPELPDLLLAAMRPESKAR